MRAYARRSLIERDQLEVERVDHAQRDRELLARGRRERQAGEPLAVLGAQQVALLRAPVVIEHRVDPLLPLGPLMGEQMPRPDPGAEIEDVRGRDPRLRQPADQQQLPQMPGISPVGLRALLLALQRGRLRRLGQVHLGADPLQFLDHEPPARRRLQRDLEPLALEPIKERADARRGLPARPSRARAPR